VLNYYSFVISGFFWSLFTRIKADFVFTYEVSPMTQALLGIWYAKRFRIPSLLYVMDLWPENLQAVAKIENKIILRHIDKMVEKIYKSSTKILTSSQSFISAIEERGIEKSKLFYWPQYAEDFYSPKEKDPTLFEEIPQDGVLNFIYTGNIGKAQGLDILPKVALKLKNQNINARFTIVGDGRAKSDLLNLINELNVSDFFNFLGSKTSNTIPNYLALCDVALLCLSESPIFKMTIPAKLQTYLACGMPIIASASGEVEELINNGNLGLCASTGNMDLMADNCSKVITDRSILAVYKKNVLEFTQKFFNKNHLLDEFDSFLISKQVGGRRCLKTKSY
jgi:glycosyltransferase involved in cell wall biosynthesis